MCTHTHRGNKYRDKFLKTYGERERAKERESSRKYLFIPFSNIIQVGITL